MRRDAVHVIRPPPLPAGARRPLPSPEDGPAVSAGAPVRGARFRPPKLVHETAMAAPAAEVPAAAMETVRLPEYKGMRGGSLTLNGFRHDELVSGMQKYIRRGELEKALRCAAEIDLFSLLGLRARALRSNLVNRLAVIAMEDIGVGSPAAIRAVYVLRRRWRAANQHAGAEDQRTLLVRMVATLVAAPKSRLVSHARECFVSETGRAIASRVMAVPTVGSSATVLDSLSEALAARDPRCVYWMSIACSGGRAAEAWALLAARSKYIPELAETVAALRDWGRELARGREAECFPACAALTCALWSEIREAPAGAQIEAPTADAVYGQCYMRVPFELDGYCLDKHTQRGRTAEATSSGPRGPPRGSARFAGEGAVITNAAPWGLREDLKAVYDTARGAAVPSAEGPLTAIPRESELFLGPVRAQLVTASYKTDTYYAAEASTGARVVVKGPIKLARAKQQLLADRIKAHMTGVHGVNYRIVYAIPDLFPDTPLGLRTSAAGVCAFLVSDDVTHMGAPTSLALPTTAKTSKVWPATPVYDRAADAAAVASHPSIDAPSVPMLLVFAYRFVVGASDPALRNVLIDAHGRAYSFDEEDLCHARETLFAARLSAGRRPAYEAVIASAAGAFRSTFESWEGALRELSVGGDAEMAKVAVYALPRIRTLLTSPLADLIF